MTFLRSVSSGLARTFHNSCPRIRGAIPRSTMFGTKLACFLVLLTGLTTAVNAQWTSQAIHLKPGWNAIFLEVQPEPRECDALLQDLPIQSVWCWNRSFDSVQFIQDPETLVPGQPDWLLWVPRNTAAR